MRRMLFFVLALSIFTPRVFAQNLNHVEAGAYVDYFRLNNTGTNFAGLGGRLGINVWKPIQLEAEMNYDFEQTFTEGFNNGTGTISTARSNLRILHGMVGPKLQTPGPVKFFVTVKGGFMDFMFDNRPATFSTFASSVQGLRADNVNAVLYPGVGAEAFLGPVGIRLDAGDEIYFSNGAQHNLRISLGPTIRF